MDRLFSTLATFFVFLFAQIFGLATAEGFGGMHIDPFHSRTALFYVMLGLSVAAAVVRWKMLGKSTTSAPSAGAAPGSASAQPRPAPVIPVARQPSPAPVASPVSGRSAEMLAAAGRQAVLFRQYFPPPHDDSILSFFGGAPIAPRGFAWPRIDREDARGVPLHFLLQVDCAAVPASARLGALPDRGVLYYFLNLEWAATDGARVIHLDAAKDEWEEIPPPPDLGPVFGKEARYAWGWVQTVEQAPALLPKWPFEPVAIALPEVPADDQDEDEDAPVLWRDAAREIQRAQGDEVVSNSISIKDVVDGNSIRRPFPTFPHDWRAVQISSAKLVERAERARRYPEMSLFREMDKDAKDALLAGISAEAQTWFDRAASEQPFDEVPATDRDSFWELLARHAGLSRYVLGDSIVLSIESSLAHSARAAARVPAEIARRLHSRHALAVTTDTGVHTNIPDRMLAPPVDVQGNQWERAQTHLLLLEISSNDGLGHHLGEGVYQFWITPDDLMARRFDRVVLTSDAY